MPGEIIKLIGPTTYNAVDQIKINNTNDGFDITGADDVPLKLRGSASVVTIRSPEDFGTIDSTKVYLIDGVVDMGSSSIEVPVGGINIIGYTFDVSQLVSSEDSYDMFYSAVGGSGNILASNVAFEASGAGSQVFNLTSATGFDAFEFTTVNFNNCTKIGTIDNYRQGLETGTGRFGGTPEIELVGTWIGGYYIDTSIVRGLTDGSYSLFKAGSGFSMNSRFRTNQNLDLPTNVSILDFTSSHFPNPSTLQLESCIITRNGGSSADDPNFTPNINASDLSCSWTSNQGLPNTFVGGLQTLTTEATTVVSVVDTPYDVAGTFSASKLEHFDVPVPGALRHRGVNPREYRVHFDGIIDGNPNNVITLLLTKWDSSELQFVEVGRQVRQINSLVGGRDVGFFNYSVATTLDMNDYLKLQVENNSGTQNITLELDSTFRVEQR